MWVGMKQYAQRSISCLVRPTDRESASHWQERSAARKRWLRKQAQFSERARRGVSYRFRRLRGVSGTALAYLHARVVVSLTMPVRTHRHATRGRQTSLGGSGTRGAYPHARVVVSLTMPVLAHRHATRRKRDGCVAPFREQAGHPPVFGGTGTFFAPMALLVTAGVSWGLGTVSAGVKVYSPPPFTPIPLDPALVKCRSLMAKVSVSALVWHVSNLIGPGSWGVSSTAADNLSWQSEIEIGTWCCETCIEVIR